MPLAVVLADVRAALFEYIIKTSQLLVIPYNITSLIQENHYRCNCFSRLVCGNVLVFSTIF